MGPYARESCPGPSALCEGWLSIWRASRFSVHCACKQAGKNRQNEAGGPSARLKLKTLIDLFVVNADFIPEVKGDVFFDVHAGQDRIAVVGLAHPWRCFLEAAALAEFVGPALIFILTGNDRFSSLMMERLQARLRR